MVKDCQSLDWIKIRSRYEQIAAKMRDAYPVASLDEYPHKILNFLRCVYYCHLLLATTTTQTHALRAKLLSFHFLDQFCAFTRERNGTIAYCSTFRMTYFIVPLFGTERCHLKRSRVNTTPERYAFRNGEERNGTIAFPCERGLRVCIDPQHFKKALKRSHYPLPLIEDVLPELEGVKVFSKIDLKEGYLRIELDEESSMLTTFQTPWGRWRYLRMPFGIKPASEHFQHKFDQCIEGLSGVYADADDALATGSGETYEEAVKNHDMNMLVLLKRCQQKNIKLNKDKFKFKCDEVSFIGHTLTQNGLKKDPTKVEAITKMSKPKDVAGVQRFIGMVKYLAKFLPRLSEVSNL